MSNTQFNDDRIQKRDFALATVVGAVSFLVYAILSPKGLDPSIWDEMAVAAGIWPPRTMFAGLWRVLAAWLLTSFGSANIASALRIAGAAIGSITMFFVYLLIRQVLAYLTRVRRFALWSWIAPFFSMVATICFGAGDAMLRMVSPLSPDAFKLLGLVVSLHLFVRFLKLGGTWRVLLSMFVVGAVAAETPVGLLLPALYYLVQQLAVDAAVNDKLHVESNSDHLLNMPLWRMFFAFLFGFFVLAGVNVAVFVSFGGLDACEWSGFDVAFQYVVGYYGLVVSAASPVGWVLSITFSLLPLVVALVLFPMLCQDTEPLRFGLGVILLFSGALALVQCGLLPYTRLWSFSSGAVEIRSDFLECTFMLMTALTLALAASCFALACQEIRMYDEDETTYKTLAPRGAIMRNLVQVLAIACMVPVLIRLHRPVETELRAIVHDAIVETVRESGDARFLFTDGRLDSGIELVAASMGSKVKPLNMMSGPSAWEKFVRTRLFAEDPAARSAVEVGVPVLLRVWAGEMKNGMDAAAVQLGFEFWRRARRPIPKCSGFVAREKGITDAEAERGVSVANAIAARIINVAKNHPNVAVSPALRSAVSAVSWRISRFARMRDDERLANELDEWNEAVKHMMRLIDYERMRTFMQLTPYEGLRLALRRADFVEARKYGATVLQMDPEDPEANFGTGMAFLMEEKFKDAEHYLERTLVKRPDEPAVLNNLSIIYRKTNRLDKALEYVKKAHELAPENEEISRTLKDTERVVKKREETLKSAFRR